MYHLAFIFFITLKHLWIFFHSVLNIISGRWRFWGTISLAPHFNEGRFGVQVRFPDLSPCECQYTRWYVGEGHLMANCMRVMQCSVHRLHKPISGVCHDLHQNMSGYEHDCDSPSVENIFKLFNSNFLISIRIWTPNRNFQTKMYSIPIQIHNHA